MSCSGLHCAGCGGGVGVPVAALVALEGAAWVAEHLVEVIAVAVTCGVLSLAAAIWLAGWIQRRDARRWQQIRPAREVPARATATVIPQAATGAQPAIEQHYHVHHHYAASPEPARVIRVLPGQAGSPITEE